MTIPRQAWLLGVALLAWHVPCADAQPKNITDFATETGQVALAWEPTWPPYLVQSSSNLASWCDQGELITNSPACTQAAAQAEACYRVRHLNPTNELGAFFGLIQTQQGEGGEPLGRHRLKSRWWLYKPQGALSNSPAAFFRQLIVFYQHIGGDGVETFAGRFDTLGAVATPGDADLLTVSWTNGTEKDQRSFTLTLNFPYNVNTDRAVQPLPSDPDWHLQCIYATPQPELDIYALTMETTTTDQVYLVQLADADTNSYISPLRNYSVVDGGITVTHSYMDGLALWQGSPPVIFMTHILDRWMAPPVVSGGGLPDFSTDSYFSRTLLPGHHNFVESVLIEPALDPALNEDVRNALYDANVRYIHTQHAFYGGMGGDNILLIGFDGWISLP
jgi:hypothetical protein